MLPRHAELAAPDQARGGPGEALRESIPILPRPTSSRLPAPQRRPAVPERPLPASTPAVLGPLYPESTVLTLRRLRRCLTQSVLVCFSQHWPQPGAYESSESLCPAVSAQQAAALSGPSSPSLTLHHGCGAAAVAAPRRRPFYDAALKLTTATCPVLPEASRFNVARGDLARDQ